jgi:uncharacterized membrane protein
MGRFVCASYLYVMYIIDSLLANYVILLLMLIMQEVLERYEECWAPTIQYNPQL